MNNFQRGYGDQDHDVAYHRFITLADANARAQRAFWRGLLIGCILTGATFILGAMI